VRRRRPLALAVAFAPLLAGCGSSTADETSSTTDDAPSADGGGYPVLVAETASGATFDLADHVGEDVMLWFWAPW
jgi:hypothetical protein